MSAVELARLPLPKPLRTAADRAGLRTVGDLAQRSHRELLAMETVGPSSIAALAVAIRALVDRGGITPDSAGLLESWRALLATLPEAQVALFERRVGLAGPPQSRVRIAGGRRGPVATAERAILRRLVRHKAWVAAVCGRVHATLADGPVEVARLAEDPWWAAATARPHAIGYFGRYLAGGSFGVVTMEGGEAFLTRTDARAKAAQDDREPMTVRDVVQGDGGAQ